MRLAGTTLGFKRPRGAETTLPSVRPRPFTNTTPVPPPPPPPISNCSIQIAGTTPTSGYLEATPPFAGGHAPSPRGHAHLISPRHSPWTRPFPQQATPTPLPLGASAHARLPHPAPFSLSTNRRASLSSGPSPFPTLPPIAARLSPVAPPPLPLPPRCSHGGAAPGPGSAPVGAAAGPRHVGAGQQIHPLGRGEAGPRGDPDSPERPQNALKWPQSGLKVTQTAPKWPQTAPKWPQSGPKCPQMAPKWP